jgi:hypothetical protein
MTLASIVVTQMAISLRSARSLCHIQMRWGRNRLVWVGIATELTLIVLLVYMPVLQRSLT